MKLKLKKKYPFLNRYLLIGFAGIMIAALYDRIVDSMYTVQLPSGEHPVELYSTELQDDLGVTISKAIMEAKESVTLVIYNLTDPRILSSLRKQSEAGIIVKVICDAKTCPNLEEKLGPKVMVLKRFIKGIMHLKILIIDSKQTWIGSANMTRESLRHHGNLILAVESEPIAEMVSAKMRTLTATERLQAIPYRSFLQGGQTLEFWFLPDDPRAIRRIRTLIREARKTIRIAMFTWTRRDFASEVVSARKRGVDVQVVLDKTSAIGAGESITRMLLSGGVKVRLSTGNALLHHKFLEIDDTILVNGSANWTLAAFDKNDDSFIVLYPLLETQKQLLYKMWAIIANDSTPAKL